MGGSDQASKVNYSKDNYKFLHEFIPALCLSISHTDTELGGIFKNRYFWGTGLGISLI